MGTNTKAALVTNDTNISSAAIPYYNGKILRWKKNAHKGDCKVQNRISTILD